jgi:hypothetical protein
VRQPLVTVGDRFGRLLVVAEAGRDVDMSHMWCCLCDCGKQRIVNTKSLRAGYVRSCGCLRAEVATRTYKQSAKARRGKSHYQLRQARKK